MSLSSRQQAVLMKRSHYSSEYMYARVCNTPSIREYITRKRLASIAPAVRMRTKRIQPSRTNNKTSAYGQNELVLSFVVQTTLETRRRCTHSHHL